MSCKMNKWWPHNWFCLKGLYYIFIVLFYLTLAYTLYWGTNILIHVKDFPNGYTFWFTFLQLLFTCCGTMLGLLTIAKILHAVRKIKKAVAPCCCDAHNEETKEEVVAVVTEEK